MRPKKWYDGHWFQCLIALIGTIYWITCFQHLLQPY